MCNWREGSRILSLRHGSGLKDVGLYRVCPMSTGEVGTFVTRMNFSDGNKSLGKRRVEKGIRC